MYYFVVYLSETRQHFYTRNEIIKDKHPVTWLREMREEFPEGKFSLLFWEKIPNEVAEKEQIHFQ